jgi:uncharacterized DUF497 family protein
MLYWILSATPIDLPIQLSAISRILLRRESFGDRILLRTPGGYAWIQFHIPHGSTLPTQALLLDGHGTPLTDPAAIDEIQSLYTPLTGVKVLTPFETSTTTSEQRTADSDQIVEVQCSSAYFEYQYPSAPQFFVGRTEILEQVQSFIDEVRSRSTSSRGMLFRAYSGWGKSSTALACIDRLRNAGDFAIAIDCRAASTPQFLLRAIDHAIKSYCTAADLTTLPQSDTTIGGFDGAINTLIQLGHELAKRNRVFLIVFDQFENLFSLPNALRPIHDALLRICNCAGNVLFGFAWKTDLVGLTDAFPYKLRDAIVAACKPLQVGRFSDKETESVLEQLRTEIRAPVRKDLQFFLSEYSQGYPWLLKRLCAHVKAQREQGTSQAEIATKVLNVEEIFQEDLSGLGSQEDDTLRAIAKNAPISVNSVGEEYDTNVVQSLVDRRLLVRIGPKYDLYWDIFRDYLNTGKVPVEEHYLLRQQIGSVWPVIKLLAESGGSLRTTTLREKAGLSEGAFLNVIRDLRKARLVEMSSHSTVLAIGCSRTRMGFEQAVRDHLKERLALNRVVRVVLRALESARTLTFDQIGLELARTCPFIAASKSTWRTYARVLSEWLDLGDLAILETASSTLNAYDPAKEVRQPRRIVIRRQSGLSMPLIQYAPLEDAALRIVSALRKKRTVDWSGVATSTRAKALATLEMLNFIERRPGRLTVRHQCIDFAERPSQRTALFADSARKLAAYQNFVELLSEYSNTKPTHIALGQKLRSRLSTKWADSTATVNAKILLDWARTTGDAPPILRRRKRSRNAR